MSYFVVDVEADGPCPGPFSMVSFGAVMVTPELDKTFYSEVISPISEGYVDEALAVSGVTRKEMEDSLNSPPEVMINFAEWIKEVNTQGTHPTFVSDNNAFDWQFINYYFHCYFDYNPFGHSSRRLADMFCGFYQKSNYRWKKHRKTKHTHHPVDDAMGNAEALLYLQSQGFNIKLI